jgi:chromosome segregation ATPase
LQRALETARHDFASKLDKLRADGALAQERLKAAETRALLEIDRERQAATRLQKELDAATRKAEQGASRHRDDVQNLQGQLGDLRQQVGVLDGALNALRTANAQYLNDAAQARGQRDNLALSLANLTVKSSSQKPPAGARTSSGPAVKSTRKRKARLERGTGRGRDLEVASRRFPRGCWLLANLDGKRWSIVNSLHGRRPRSMCRPGKRTSSRK